MVEVSASSGFLEVLTMFAEDEKLSNTERKLIRKDLETKHISLNTFRCVQKHRPDMNIHAAMRGCRVTSPHESKAQASREAEATSQRLAKRRAFLQRQHETREYNRMVHGSSRLMSDNEETISSAIQSVKYQAAISSNMLAAMAGVFAVCYYAAQKFMEWDKNQCLTAGLVGAICILLIEMALYIIRAHKMDRIQTQEAKKTDATMKISSG